MNNILGREGGERPYEGAHAHVGKYVLPSAKSNVPERVDSFDALFEKVTLADGMTLSFHHHLRNGDGVLNAVMEAVHAKGVKNLRLAPSSLFPVHAPLVPMMEDGTVTQIETSYVSGPVADAISRGVLATPARITTHGGRPRAILSGELPIDIAFIAAPAVAADGAVSGTEGPSACGSLGYAVADAQMARVVVAITDHPVEHLEDPDISAGYVQYVLVVDQIGDPNGIVSGTTRITRDPIGLKIARDAARVIESAGLLVDGFSLQTGAGGISLAVADAVTGQMREKKIRGSFGCGGVTGYFVNMLEEGLFEDLYDVQCFDLAAIASLGRNAKHHRISADTYANPDNPEHVAVKLDCVILGASEIDRNFHVNVTTGLDGRILGGSGGHADTATGAKLTMITTKLFNARISAVVDAVRTITTPGEVVDCVVTEYGVAVNPARPDLREKLAANSMLEVVTIDELADLAQQLTGKPRRRPDEGDVVAYSVYRDGTILDVIRKVEE